MSELILKLDHRIDFIIILLDRARQNILRLTLRSNWLAKTYQNYESRNVSGLLIWTLIIFPMALLRPDILLVAGPFVFGYPHVVASYRYLFLRQKFYEKYRSRLFLIFSIFTVITIAIYQSQAFFSEISFAVWPPLLAILALLTAHVTGLQRSKKLFWFGALIGLGFAFFAWQEPLLYAGAILMIHNFTAFAHWIASSRDLKRRNFAIISTILFLAVHVFVLSGGVDTWLQATRLQDWKIESTAWFLASWSQDPLVWYRWLVLYTFGLSLHYYIWLRAIPENEIKSGTPLCFRLSLQEWRKDLGSTSLFFAILITALGLSVWAIHFKMGQVIYFQIALLHGALELIFLPSKICEGQK
jgi:hypothetical protein